MTHVMRPPDFLFLERESECRSIRESMVHAAYQKIRTVSASVLGSFDFRQIAISSIGFVILAIGIAICLKPKLPKTEADTVLCIQL